MAAAIQQAELRAFITTPQTRSWGLDAWLAGSILIQRGLEGAGVSSSGTIAPGRYAYFLIAERSSARRCNGEEIDGGSIYRWAPAAEISALSRRPSEWVALVATESSVHRAHAVLEGVPDPGHGFGSRVSRGDPPGVAALRRLLAEAARALEGAGPEGLHPEAARNLEETFLLTLARLCPERAGSGAAGGRAVLDRARVLRRIEELLNAAGPEPVYVSALCERLGLPERTLRYVFEEQFGASPMRVLRSRRLCEARRALRTATPGTRVSELAGRFGFWHLGQFATDYRKLFGERPSETLRQAARRDEGAPHRLSEWAETSGRLG